MRRSTRPVFLLYEDKLRVVLFVVAELVCFPFSIQTAPSKLSLSHTHTTAGSCRTPHVPEDSSLLDLFMRSVYTCLFLLLQPSDLDPKKGSWRNLRLNFLYSSRRQHPPVQEVCNLVGLVFVLAFID